MIFFNLKKITKFYFAFLAFCLGAGFVSAQTSSLRSLASSGALSSSSSKVGQQTNETPDAQIAMSVSNYPVTAGDIYTLAFAAGSTPISYSIPVDSTYKIRIANLGVINCKGLTYLELKNQVTSIVQKNYPMGGVQFVLTSPATFLVTLTGEVQKTVQKNAWALTRLSSLLKDKDALTEYSSKRNIKIISESGTEKTYDLFLADRKGDLSQDPCLRPGDRIEVNRISRKVTLKGAVERPGTYELLDGENLKELIDYYGSGPASLADLSRIELYREKTDAANSGEKIYLDEQSYKDDYALLCYDSVYVSSYKDLKPVIYVEGAVNSAGILKADDENSASIGENVVLMDDSKTVSTDENLSSSTKISVQFNAGEDYAFFIRRYKDMFTSVSDLENSYVIRGEEHIPVNVSQILYDENFRTKIEMKANDVLLVPFKQFFVSVSGAVASPGRYPYIPDRTYDYYVGLAGGFIRERNKNDAVVITDTDGKKHKKSEFILPEMTIEAKANSGLYYFNQYAPVVSTILSALATSLSAYAVINSL